MNEKELFEDLMDNCPCGPDEWVGRIISGDLEATHASVWVCGRETHQDAATGWAELVTGIPARIVRKE